jgi:hypothetical protein
MSIKMIDVLCFELIKVGALDVDFRRPAFVDTESKARFCIASIECR